MAKRRRSREQAEYNQRLKFLLKTAADMMAERGYHDTSIRDIARAAGMSMAGIYYYFKNKEELLYLIQDYCLSSVTEGMERALSGESDPCRKLMRFIENHLNFFANNLNEMKVLAHEEGARRGRYYRSIRDKKRRYVESCAAILRELEKSYGLDRRLDLRVATFLLFGMMNWIYSWYNPKKELKAADLAEAVARIFLFGFLGGRASEARLSETMGRRLPEEFSVWRKLDVAS